MAMKIPKIVNVIGLLVPPCLGLIAPTGGGYLKIFLIGEAIVLAFFWAQFSLHRSFPKLLSPSAIIQLLPLSIAWLVLLGGMEIAVVHYITSTTYNDGVGALFLAPEFSIILLLLFWRIKNYGDFYKINYIALIGTALFSFLATLAFVIYGFAQPFTVTF